MRIVDAQVHIWGANTSAAEFARFLHDEETKLKALVKSGVLKGE